MTEPVVSLGGGPSPQERPSCLRARFASPLSGPGAVSFVVATAGVGVSNFVFHVVSSRLLGPSYYGGLGALLNVLTLLAVPLGAVQLAVTQAVVRRREQGRPSPIGRLTGQGALGGLLGAGVLVAVAPVLSGFLHLHSALAVLVLAAWLPLASAGSVLQGALIGELRFKPVALASFLGGGPVRLGLGAALIFVGGGVAGAIGATVGAQTVTTLLLVKAARASLSKGSDQLQAPLSDTAVSVLALGGYTVLTGIDTFLAQHFLAAVSAGQYAAAATAGHVALFLPGAVVMVAFPQLAEGRGRSARSRTALGQAFVFTSALGLAAAGVLVLFAPRVVEILFGRAYQPAASAVGILGLESAVLGLVGLLTYFHIARRSRVALLPWAGGALAAGTVALFHGGLVSIAMGMLVVAAVVLAAELAPALGALVRSVASERAVPVPAARLCEAPTLDLTVVVPFYNPGPRFAAHLGQVVDALEATGATFEVLAVSDGSTDGSPALAEGLRPDVLRVISFDENQGKGAALRAGFDAGHGRWLGFIDGDGDLPGALLTRFVEMVMTEEPDVLLGSKRHPTSRVEYPPLRRLYSRAYQLLNWALFSLPVRDTQTGVKFVRREVLADVLPRMLEKRYAFDLELLVVASHLGYRRFVEAPVTVLERFTSTISLRAVWHMLIDTLAIFYRLRVLHHYGAGAAQLPFPVSPALAAPAGAGRQADAVGTERVHEETTPRLRILICNWKDTAHPRAGGAEVYTAALAGEWVREGHSVTLFCAAVRGRPEVEDVDGVRIVRRGGRFGVYRAARRFFEEAGGAFDLVVDEVNTRPFFCPRFARGVPVVALVHQVCREVWDCELPWPLSWLGRRVLEPRWLATYRDVPVVTVSESSRSALEAYYGLRRVTVVSPGQLSALVQAREAPADREPVPTVVFVGRLSRSKQADQALRAFEIYRRLAPEAQMWVIGTGPEESRLKRLASPGVRFLGRVSEEEKLDRLARADVLVATSVREGWGLVVSEAAAAGTPTVAYDVPGLRDSVSASGGVLTGAGPSALADVLARYVPIWRAAPRPVPGVAARGLLPWG
ncbi:MAG: glycosyltransferase, partial [Actinomycetota bacterium]|nr:glycosyltransferase [Actinomycetota bacterium]